MTPMYFWKTTQQFAEPMRKLASFVFQLKGHAAPMETLFSLLSYSKPKIKHKMTTDNLKILGSICKSLKDSIPTQCKNDWKRDKAVGVEVNDMNETTATIEETEVNDNSDNTSAIVVELVDHPNDVENNDFEAEFEQLMIANIEDADADTTLGQHEDQMFVSIDNADLDGMIVPMPPPTPLPPPEEVATPVANDSTYIWDMFTLELLQKMIQSDKKPKA